MEWARQGAMICTPNELVVGLLLLLNLQVLLSCELLSVSTPAAGGIKLLLSTVRHHSYSMIVAHQEVWARHDFSLAWLEAEGNLREGVLARLKGSRSHKGCVFCFTLLLNSRVLLAVYWNCRSCRDVLYMQTLSSGSFFFSGVLFAEGGGD